MPDQSATLLHILGHALDETGGLFDRLVSGELAPAAWERAMQKMLFKSHAAAYLASSGQRAFTVADQNAVRTSLAPQYEYLRRFASEIAAGDMTQREAAWRARANMYAGSVKAAYWRGATRGYNLPAMPAEGTACAGNCGCRWDVRPLDSQGNANAYWIRGKDDSCKTCIDRAGKWAPLPIRPAVGG